MELYNSLAPWMPLLTPAENYRLEASIYRRLFLSHNPRTRTVLELGCGAGNNASHLKQRFTMTLTDRSPQMLRLSRSQNPECTHVQGDMRTLRLKQRFDAVFIHDAIAYMQTVDELKEALATAYVHCEPGGQVLIQPDYFTETFKAGTSHGGIDRDGRGMRYLMWVEEPQPDSHFYNTHFAFLLRHEDGSVTAEQETHTMGLFSEAQWLESLAAVGLTGEILQEPYADQGIPYLQLISARRPAP